MIGGCYGEREWRKEGRMKERRQNYKTKCWTEVRRKRKERGRNAVQRRVEKMQARNMINYVLLL